MLSNLGKEVQRVEDLEIPVHSCTEIAAGRFRKAPAILMFRLVDHMSGRGYLQDPIQAERATGDILDKPLERIAVRGGNEHTLVNAEPGMLPRAHLFNDLMGNQHLAEEQLEHLVLPEFQKRLDRESRQGNERPILSEYPVTHNRVDMRMPPTKGIRP